MRRAAALLTFAFAFVAAPLASAQTDPGFAAPVTMPGSAGGNEPSLAISTAGVRYVSWQAPGTFASSPDGHTFTALGQPDSGSLGDVTNAVDAAGAVYNAQICGAPEALHTCVYKSTDGGHTWTSHRLADEHPGASDRPWIDVYPKKASGSWDTNKTRVYLEFHTFSPDDLVYVTVSDDGGKTFSAPHVIETDTAAASSSYCNTIPGGVQVAANGDVYALWLSGNDPVANANGCNYSQLGPFNKAWVSVSTDGGTTWSSHLAWQGAYDPSTHVGDNADKIFPALAVDAAEQVHVVLPVRHNDDPVGFVAQCEAGTSVPGVPSLPVPPLPAPPTVPLPPLPALPPVPGLPGLFATDDSACSETPQRTDLYLVTSPDKGAHWTSPLMLNRFAGSYFFPWAAGGAAGTVDVAYYRSDTLKPNDPSSRWGIGFSQVVGAKAVTDAAGTHYVSTPSVTEQLLDPNPVHVGGICSFGIFCSVVPQSNRDLADSIAIALDPDGGANVVWTNDAKKTDSSGKAVSEVDFACQDSGRSAASGEVDGCSNAASVAHTTKNVSSTTVTAIPARRFVRGRGVVAHRRFAVDLRRGVGKVSFGSLRSLHLTSIRLAAHAARLTGIGTIGGARVRFAVVMVDHGAAGDIFRIDWMHGRAHGGVVRHGYVTIR